MRNVGGVLAQRRLWRAVIATLTIAGQHYQWLSSESNIWLAMSEDDSEIEWHLRGISWRTGKQSRTLPLQPHYSAGQK
jgi:hypothetical protein